MKPTLEELCGENLIENAKYVEETLMVHSVKGNTVEAAIIVVIEAPDGSIWKSYPPKDTCDRLVRFRLYKQDGARRNQYGK